jgi:sulfhydrogenase subunit gamma (sulfur reductase)
MTIADVSQRKKFFAQNVYVPHIAVIEKIIEESPMVRTFHFNFKDEKLRKEFTFESGQFADYTVFGVGEAPFCISSSPTRRDHYEFAANRVGKVTNALHRLGVGAEIGVRGPYGNSFPLDFLKGKNLVFVGGGIGLAPLRSLIWNVIDNRKLYGKVDIIYGARSPADLCFKYDLESWGKDSSLNMVTTIDRPFEGWTGRVGMVPTV